MKKYLFIIFWSSLVLLLVYFSSSVYNPTTSILAQVEPAKQAVSFHKAVKVKEIYVIPGQKVKEGAPLLKVERQDLLLDVETKTSYLENLRAEKEGLEVQIEYEKNLNKSNLDYNILRIDADLKRLELVKDEQQILSKSISELNVWNDTTTAMDQTYIEMRISVLRNEKQKLLNQHNLLVAKSRKINELKQKEIDNNISLVEEELKLLMQEETDLIQIAEKDGIIGNVYAEVNELVTPFSTLVSVYDNNPSVIRALVNEDLQLNLEPDQEVIVESTNRKYRTSGTVLEIGSRIVEYPSRLKQNQELLIYGRELFISISDKSDFLHGEKVFVKIK